MTEGRRSATDPRDEEPRSRVQEPAEVERAGATGPAPREVPGSVQPIPGEVRRPVKPTTTRASAVWTALAVGVLVLVAILIFVVQNSAKVRINFLWMHGTLGLGIALLISAILGILLTLAVGSVRMLQLRRLAKRPHVVERRR
jgi:uncharacterized integral membrane protein